VSSHLHRLYNVECTIGKDMEGSSYDMCYCTILLYAWRDWTETWKYLCQHNQSLL